MSPIIEDALEVRLARLVDPSIRGELLRVYRAALASGCTLAEVGEMILEAVVAEKQRRAARRLH